MNRKYEWIIACTMALVLGIGIGLFATKTPTKRETTTTHQAPKEWTTVGKIDLSTGLIVLTTTEGK